ncbi:hypothetical protein BU14_0401s0010 [Porphyra umbilicalis]|uniref:Superoxide dismutase n=1 Tax=Porphyra umbilicalis TaxID=2786 RepID=A0A1X6NW43_PORUM|nr:hypothetical protein BU14_0401s0010 [Porphyra umbilicalis]|eukprot:OSX72839.1 hypothetical protein BU14_0401s0010 [Porphyra umbilicalis]
MKLHHDKHFAAYTKKLNAALAAAGLADVVTTEGALRKLLANVGSAGGRGGSAIADPALRAAIRNNGGGVHVNHQLFFRSMTAPGTSPAPSVVLSEAIDGGFGSFDKMRSAFSAAATGLFGSGWVWLAVDTAGGNRMVVTTTANQDVPYAAKAGVVPILGLDVWEHAYYVQYQNRRPEYVEAWWSVVDWPGVEKRYTEAVEENA